MTMKARKAEALLKRLIAIVLTLGFAPLLRAQMTPVCMSLDASVDEASTVVVAHVDHVGEATPDKYGKPRSPVVFYVEQVIKGAAPQRLTLDSATRYASDYLVNSWDPGPDDFKNDQRAGTRLMLFLNGGGVWIINLDNPDDRSVTADLKLLRTPKELIQAAKEQVLRTPGVKQDFGEAVAPRPQLRGTHFEHCTIYIPIDDRLLKTEEGRKELADRAQNDPEPYERAAAKSALDRWFAQPSFACDEGELSVTRSLVSERKADPDAEISFTQKWVERMGDSAARCLLKNYGLDGLKETAMEKAVISIVRDSFSAPELIEHANDKSPSASLLLLSYIQSLQMTQSLQIGTSTSIDRSNLHALIQRFDRQQYKDSR